MSRSSEWYEAFFGGLYGKVLAAQFTEERSLGQGRVVRRLLGLRKGQRVLDIPCGQGRLTIPLAQMGLRMTGVDITASFVHRARRRAAKKNSDIRFLIADMRDITFDGEFDAAVNWFTSVGFFCDEDELAFCRRVRGALRPGGRFLVETINRSRVLAKPRGPRDETIGGVRVIDRVRWDPATGRIVGTWTLQYQGRTERNRIRLRLYDGSDLRALLRAAGFTDIRLFGWPPVGRLTRWSRRLIAVARRPLR